MFGLFFQSHTRIPGSNSRPRLCCGLQDDPTQGGLLWGHHSAGAPSYRQYGSGSGRGRRADVGGDASCALQARPRPRHCQYPRPLSSRRWRVFQEPGPQQLLAGTFHALPARLLVGSGRTAADGVVCLPERRRCKQLLRLCSTDSVDFFFNIFPLSLFWGRACARALFLPPSPSLLSLYHSLSSPPLLSLSLRRVATARGRLTRSRAATPA